MTEKKNGRPTQPGSHSVSYQHRRRKPTPILHRLAAKCKSLNRQEAGIGRQAHDNGRRGTRTYATTCLCVHIRRGLPGKYADHDRHMGSSVVDKETDENVEGVTLETKSNTFTVDV